MTVRKPAYMAGTYTGADLRIASATPYARSDDAGASGPIKPRSGVISDRSLKVTATGTPSMQLQVAAGVLILQGAGDTQGAYICPNDTTATVTIAAANASLARKDAVIARLYDADDGVTGNGYQWVLTVITGTAAASPALPSIPTDAFLLAEINVPANDTAIDNTQIVDRRVFTVAHGGVLPCTSTTLPTTPHIGQVVWRTDTSSLELWSGTAWRPITFGTIVGNVSTTTTSTTGISAEAKDTNLADVTFTAIAGRRYRVTVNLRIQASVGPTTVDIRVRDGLASSPVVASAQLAGWSAQINTAGGPGASSLTFTAVLVGLAAGTHKLGVFAARTSGTGLITLDLSGGGKKELYVEDLG